MWEGEESQDDGRKRNEITLRKLFGKGKEEEKFPRWIC